LNSSDELEKLLISSTLSPPPPPKQLAINSHYEALDVIRLETFMGQYQALLMCNKPIHH